MTRSLHALTAAALLASLLAACASAPPLASSKASTKASSAAPIAAPITVPLNTADRQRQAAFDKSQDSWTGAKVQELVAKLGPPTSKGRQADGSAVYVYSKSSKSGATTTFSCVVRYLVDARNERVTGHQIEGC